MQDLIDTKKTIFEEEKKKLVKEVSNLSVASSYYALNLLRTRCYYHNIEGYNNVLDIFNKLLQKGGDKAKILNELQEWLLYIYDVKFSKENYTHKVDLDYVLDVVRCYSHCKLIDVSNFIIFLNKNKNLQKLFPYESIPSYTLNHTSFLVDALAENGDTEEIRFWCDNMFFNKKQEIYKFSDGRNIFDILISRYLNMDNRNEKIEVFLISLYEKYKKNIKSSTYPKDNKIKTNILKDMFLCNDFKYHRSLSLPILRQINQIIANETEEEKSLRSEKEYKEKIEKLKNRLDKKLFKIQLFKNIFPEYYNLCHKTMQHSNFLDSYEISHLFNISRELKDINDVGVFFDKIQVVVDLLDIKHNYNKNYTTIMVNTTCCTLTKTYRVSDINEFSSYKKYCLDLLDFIYSQPLCQKSEYLSAIEDWAKKTIENKRVTDARDKQQIEICKNALNFIEKEKINLSLQHVDVNTEKTNVKKIQKI